ncbi:RNA recognition motif domain [Dillenia turbinata]|uniref:RNA recognition motif domain n=1 Tax=Dillenia turbinata TaxID=194707 RepID=A0AAN8UQ47_9MAGN
MAFFNRAGSLVRQSFSQKNTLTGPNPVASMFNAVRCVTSSTKLFIGGLSWQTNDESLKDAFSSFGDVNDARVIVDRETGRSRGFGFVEFSTNESASSALTAMDGQELNGRNIRVTFANEQAPRPRFGSGGFGSSGGYGNDGGVGGNSQY